LGTVKNGIGGVRSKGQLMFLVTRDEIVKKLTLSPAKNSVANSKFDLLLFLVICLITLAAYYGLHSCYNIYYEDDSWTMSNAWNLVNLGVDHDLVFLDQENVFTGQLFGKVYFFLSGNVLNLIGWTKGNVFLINSALIFASAFVWFKILQDLPDSCKMSKWLPLFLPIFPPCFFAAHTGRTDAFTLFLLSIGFLMFVRKYYVVAGILSMLAIESHIMGVVSLFYYLSYFIYSEKKHFTARFSYKDFRADNALPLTKSMLGFAVGIIIYMSLHYKVFDLEQLSNIVRSKSDMVSPVNNYILAYFTDFDWYYHLPEMALFITTIVLYLRNGLYRKNPLLLIMLVVLVFSTFITRRENRNYFIYLVPAVMMFYFYTYRAIGQLRPFMVVLTLICMSYYSALYVAHKDFKFSDFVSFIDNNASDKEIPIIGMPDVWFAAMERDFYPIHTERDFNKIDFKEFYLVETDYLSIRSRVYDQVKSNIYKNYNCEKISQWDAYSNNKSTLCHCVRNGKSRVALVYDSYPGWQTVMADFFPTSIF